MIQAQKIRSETESSVAWESHGKRAAKNSLIAAAINIVRSRSLAWTSRSLARIGSALSLFTTRAGECCRAASCTRKRKMGRSRQRRWRRRRRGIGGPLASTTDKNRYYEFTAAPRLRGIATITSSVVARVVGARTPVASPAVANAVVVVDVRRRRRRRIFMFICNRLRSFSSFWPPPPLLCCVFPIELSHRGPEARNQPRGRYAGIYRVSREATAVTWNCLDTLGDREENIRYCFRRKTHRGRWLILSDLWIGGRSREFRAHRNDLIQYDEAYPFCCRNSRCWSKSASQSGGLRRGRG